MVLVPFVALIVTLELPTKAVAGINDTLSLLVPLNATATS